MEWQKGLVSVGLGKPYQRMCFGALLIGGIAYATKKPGMCFDEDGNTRPCKFWSEEPTATTCPFFLLPLAGATFGIFV